MDGLDAGRKERIAQADIGEVLHGGDERRPGVELRGDSDPNEAAGLARDRRGLVRVWR
jgi:hypothetical protein